MKRADLEGKAQAHNAVESGVNGSNDSDKSSSKDTRDDIQGDTEGGSRGGNDEEDEPGQESREEGQGMLQDIATPSNGLDMAQEEDDEETGDEDEGPGY